MKMSSVIFVIFLVIGCAVSDLVSDNDDSVLISHLSSASTDPSPITTSSLSTTNSSVTKDKNGTQSNTDISNLSISNNSPKTNSEGTQKISKDTKNNTTANQNQKLDAVTSKVQINQTPTTDDEDSNTTENNTSTQPTVDSTTPNVTTEDGDTSKNTSESVSIPKELPADAFVCPDSESCIRNLTAHNNPNNNDTNIGSEIVDLRNSTDEVLREEAEIDAELNQPNNTQQITSSEVIDTDTGLIDDGDNTEEKIRQAVTKEFLEEAEAGGPGVPLIQGQLAAILAAVFVAVSVFAYVALLWWRRYLEHRYGTRQMLVNEEDFDDINDLRHFSI